MPGRPVIAGGAYDNVIFELIQLLGKAVLECEEEDVATTVGRSASGRLDRIHSDKRGVIADGDTRRQDGLSVDLFIIAIPFRPFSDGIVDLLFV